MKTSNPTTKNQPSFSELAHTHIYFQNEKWEKRVKFHILCQISQKEETL